jgi:hypothetical protein
MVKVMGNSDVLRCLAKNITYIPISPGRYRADANCDRKCEPLGKLGLCRQLRQVINASEGVFSND